MATLSITQAWNETAEFVRREAGLLLPVSFMLLALPNALMELLILPPPMPGQAPEPAFGCCSSCCSSWPVLIGNVAISYLAIRPGSSVGEALRRGAAHAGAAGRGHPARHRLRRPVLHRRPLRRHAGARRDDRRPGRHADARHAGAILYVMLITLRSRSISPPG